MSNLKEQLLELTPVQEFEQVDASNKRIIREVFENEEGRLVLEYQYQNPVTHPAWGAQNGVTETLTAK